MSILVQGIICLILIGAIAGLALLVDHKSDYEDYRDDE